MEGWRAKAMVSGAHLDPGESIIFFTCFLAQISAIFTIGCKVKAGTSFKYLIFNSANFVRKLQNTNFKKQIIYNHEIQNTKQSTIPLLGIS